MTEADQTFVLPPHRTGEPRDRGHVERPPHALSPDAAEVSRDTRPRQPEAPGAPHAAETGTPAPPATVATTAVDVSDDDIETLFRLHYRRLCRVIYRIVGRTDLAEELAGDAFWKLHRKRPTLTNADAWLCRTGVRLALDHLRRERRRRYYETAAFDAGARGQQGVAMRGTHSAAANTAGAGLGMGVAVGVGAGAGAGAHGATTTRPAIEPAVPAESEQALARADEQRQVREVLAAIKPAQATLLLLRAEGLTYAEIAAALRINPASVGTMLARAEARFKQVYEARHPREGHHGYD